MAPAGEEKLGRLRILCFLQRRIGSRLEMFCYVLKNKMGPAYDYNRLKGATDFERARSLVEIADQNCYLADLVFYLVEYWVDDDQGGNPQVLREDGLDDDLRICGDIFYHRGDGSRIEGRDAWDLLSRVCNHLFVFRDIRASCSPVVAHDGVFYITISLTLEGSSPASGKAEHISPCRLPVELRPIDDRGNYEGTVEVAVVSGSNSSREGTVAVPIQDPQREMKAAEFTMHVEAKNLNFEGLAGAQVQIVVAQGQRNVGALGFPVFVLRPWPDDRENPRVLLTYKVIDPGGVREGTFLNSHTTCRSGLENEGIAYTFSSLRDNYFIFHSMEAEEASILSLLSSVGRRELGTSPSEERYEGSKSLSWRLPRMPRRALTRRNSTWFPPPAYALSPATERQILESSPGRRLVSTDFFLRGVGAAMASHVFLSDAYWAEVVSRLAIWSLRRNFSRLVAAASDWKWSIWSAKMEVGGQRSSEVFVGIDFGTTYSSVAVPLKLLGKRLRAIEDVTVISDNTRDGYLVPSVVAVDSTGKCVAGVSARRQAKTDTAPILCAKTVIDKKDMCFERRGRRLQPEQVVAEIFAYLKALASKQANASINGAVIAVPAHFNRSQRQRIRKAAKAAELGIVKLIEDPVAVATMCYETSSLQSVTAMICDFGGGAFEVVIIMRRSKGTIEIRGKAWSYSLGGSSLDLRVALWIAGRLQRNGYSLDRSPESSEMTILRVEAEKVRIALLERKKGYRMKSDAMFRDGQGKIAPISMEIPAEIIDVEEIVNGVIELCRMALERAELKAEDLDEILLTGGCSQMLQIDQRLKDAFGVEV